MNFNYTDIEFMIYDKLKNYLDNNSRYSPKVFNKAPKQLVQFPTVVFKESSNSEDTRHKTLDYSQWVNQITFTIEVYTQDMVANNGKVASKIIMSELKYLLIDFFEKIGFTRVSCDYVDYYVNDIDRLVMVVRTSQASWSGKIL